jgi:hypothetical protein
MLCVNKFCEIPLLLNIDPLHKLALHIVIILMCKNSNPIAVARRFSEEVHNTECLNNVEEKKEIYIRCAALCSTMSDWITLFQFLELKLENESQHVLGEPSEGQKLQREIGKNRCIACMTQALITAQVSGEHISPAETAIMAFLYISPRTTPAGNMLERLYCGINSNARDTELRCLRVLSLFNDAPDVENGFTETMSSS